MGRLERNEWIEKAKQRVLDNAKETDKWAEEIMGLYDETTNQLETEINAMFQKYAKDNRLTEAEASRLLTGEEYKRWRKSMDGYLKEAEGNSKTLLELNTLSAKSRISRKEQMLASIYQSMMTLSGDVETRLTDLLGDMFQTNYYRGCYDIQSIAGVGFNIAKVDEGMLKRILGHPWSGKNYSQALWENTDKLAALAKREITIGFMSGSSVQKMAKEINDIMGKGKYAAERLVRTECSYFSNQGELQSYRDLGITEYIFLGGGCDICQQLGDRSFPISEAEPGLNMPPMHPHCKCTIIPKSSHEDFWKRQGANPLEKNLEFEKWKEKYVDRDNPKFIIKLTGDEKHALNSYLSSEAYTLNDKQRRGVALTKAEQKMVDNLDAALSKMPVYQGTVYRSVSDFGIEDVDAFIRAHVVNEIMVFPSYLSCSTSVYDESFPIQYVIQSKMARDIREFNQKEQETIFERKKGFRITKVEGNTIYMEEI